MSMINVLLDPEDEHLRIFYSLDNNGYSVLERNRKRFLLHRVIMNCPEGYDVDHINGIRTDNRKANLRICTRSQNCANAKLRAGNKAGYKGVTKYGNKWQARLGVDYKVIHIGTYLTKEEAALAYNKAAVKHFGEFAKLNIIESET